MEKGRGQDEPQRMQRGCLSGTGGSWKKSPERMSWIPPVIGVSVRRRGGEGEGTEGFGRFANELHEEVELGEEYCDEG